MSAMATFIYRCPATGYAIQGFVADAPESGGDHTYRPVTCTACTRVHLVNPKTGKVAGDDGRR